MKADYQHLDLLAENNLIRAFWIDVPSFGFHWHYHPELEITCVRQGRGTRMVGDNVSPFSSGDFVFMGSNLPHTWISDDDFNSSPQHMEVAVLQFHPSLLTASLLGLPELRNIRQLLRSADRGIELTAGRREAAADLLFQLIAAEGFERFNLFFQLLNYLGAAEPDHLLASKAYAAPLNESTEERILQVCRYVHEHFMRPIKLDTVARIAHMNASAFCRFFRKTTGQTFSEYINDLRVTKACNLLLDQRQLSISEIAYQSGFNSQTLFNRIFLKKKNRTPSQFRRFMKSKMEK